MLRVGQACFAVADVFKGWGNNTANLVPWMVRLCHFAKRLDACTVCAQLPEERREEGTEILRGMREQADAGLGRLAEEHGAQFVAGL